MEGGEMGWEVSGRNSDCLGHYFFFLFFFLSLEEKLLGFFPFQLFSSVCASSLCGSVFRGCQQTVITATQRYNKNEAVSNPPAFC